MCWFNLRTSTAGGIIVSGDSLFMFYLWDIVVRMGLFQACMSCFITIDL